MCISDRTLGHWVILLSARWFACIQNEHQSKTTLYSTKRCRQTPVVSWYLSCRCNLLYWSLAVVTKKWDVRSMRFWLLTHGWDRITGKTPFIKDQCTLHKYCFKELCSSHLRCPSSSFLQHVTIIRKKKNIESDVFF